MPWMKIVIYIAGVFISQLIYVPIFLAMMEIADRRKRYEGGRQSNAVSTLAFLLFCALIWPIGVPIMLISFILYALFG